MVLFPAEKIHIHRNCNLRSCVVRHHAGLCTAGVCIDKVIRLRFRKSRVGKEMTCEEILQVVCVEGLTIQCDKLNDDFAALN